MASFQRLCDRGRVATCSSTNARNDSGKDMFIVLMQPGIRCLAKNGKNTKTIL
jgi:hypothetical protein